MKELESTIRDMLECNKQFYGEHGFDLGYAYGYHDALAELMTRLNIPHNEPYFD